LRKSGGWAKKRSAPRDALHEFKLIESVKTDHYLLADFLAAFLAVDFFAPPFLAADFLAAFFAAFAILDTI
jgi:hypothetical protein